ncbi:gamma-glutamyl-gamma-aminobutyrate hydrolase family protein [Mesosutterella sp. OilRF-GAM-744-9]|uniref:Gamma-glutamyl-gamma-aminobutyrate hydrolase family protein n=1 Tax=Mesosutterella porci TaxID=2915351 RepID=A0ABS9MS37_9BURK|nr:gamma-glutamyl-gamma-aminobutyrate hydrolase family protein [Mesosutterella sp. oilRF-744-WT-GAM-9]MCG5031436.1 gamma-glutamyl-gamma-aminobutyrate hydrolase family protein [Mesosutterella sp. oilRF-744-WT-GAM-9]
MTKRRPRIAVTATAGEVPQMPAMTAYNESDGLLEVIESLGGVPVIFAETERVPPEAYTQLFDGFIAPGGCDVAPHFYGEEPRRGLGRTTPVRDAFEIGIIRAARSQGLPVFGICRGLQVINVALGGTLYQDIPTELPGSFVQHSQKAAPDRPVHHVSIEPGSRLAAIFGEEAFVNSRHHQAVKDPAPSLAVAARAKDGVVEALESGDGLVSAVQWHPEDLWQRDQAQRRLFEVFMDLAAAAAARRA